MILQIMLYGVLVGAVYGLSAAGLALLLGVMKYLNIAHGTFIMLSGYISYWLFTLLKVDPLLSLPVVTLVMFMIGLILYKTLFAHLTKVPNVGRRIGSSMLITFGLMWILDNTMTWLWTSDVRSVTTSYTGEVLTFWGLKLPYSGLASFFLAMAALYFLHLLLHKSYLGKAIRVTALDWETAGLMGIDVNKTYLISTGIAMAMNAVAGTAILAIYSITPGGGLEWLMKAMIVMVLAGEGKISAILTAGIALGIVEGLAVSVAGSAYREVVGLLAFVLVLLLRPEGVFSKRVGRKTA